MVPSYRLYCLDGAGKIATAEWIEAANEEEAVRKVRERKIGLTCELWHRNRLLARIDAEAA